MKIHWITNKFQIPKEFCLSEFWRILWADQCVKIHYIQGSQYGKRPRAIYSESIKPLCRPVNLHPLFLKIRHPAFWKMGHPVFWKKQAEKNRVIVYSKREETRLPLLFLNYNDLGFLHSVFFFKKQGAWFSKSRVPNF